MTLIIPSVFFGPEKPSGSTTCNRTCLGSRTASPIPVIIAAFASAVTSQYFLQPKYLIFCAPFLLLMVLDAALTLKSARLRQSIAILGIFVFLIAYMHYSNPAAYGRKENWREAALFLSQEVNDESGIVIIGNEHLTYYAPALKSAIIDFDIPQFPLTANSPDSARLRGQCKDKQTLFYLNWETIQNLKDPRNYLITALDQMNGEHTVYPLNPRLKIFIWKRPPPIPAESQ